MIVGIAIGLFIGIIIGTAITTCLAVSLDAERCAECMRERETEIYHLQNTIGYMADKYGTSRAEIEKELEVTE